jgi:hypothetical protein
MLVVVATLLARFISLSCPSYYWNSYVLNYCRLEPLSTLLSDGLATSASSVDSS